MMAFSLVSHSPTRIEIDLNAFQTNVKKIKKHAKNTPLLAVIKTNAYGHGIKEIAEEAILSGADRLGVTAVEEGALLREAGIQVPIQLLSAVNADRAEDIVRYDLTASISSEDQAKAISQQAISQEKEIAVHLKLDTGLHRFGIDPEQAIDFCGNCYKLPGLFWEGIYTHFSSADEGNWGITKQQFNIYQDTVQSLEKKGFHFPLHHVGGSTIAIERPDMYLDLIRPGICLFGYPPAPRQRKLIALKPVMSLKSQVLQVRELNAFTPVGYGGSYVTKKRERIAVIPVGLGDGYKRSMSNKGEMLIKGRRAKIIGHISLDQTIVNVTGIPDVQPGDEAVLLGKQGNDSITAWEIAEWTESIVDEVLASWMDRMDRVYRKE